MRDRSKSKDLLLAFRESRQQVEQPVETVGKSKRKQTETFSKGFSKRDKSNDPYVRFLEKYDDLENTIDSFKTQDLTYFFREKAQEAGVKYVIANLKRDNAVFKKLQDNYSVREICLMIEFIFFSGQNYLDITNTQPTVLVSTWCNTIYRDSLLWVEDKYKPYEKVDKRKAQISKREWDREVEGERSKIGEWD